MGERDRAARWGPALLRWYVAATFLGFHGRHKAQELLGGDLSFVQTVAALGLPAPAMFAALAVTTQLGAGLCLLLGAATRPAALALAVTMVFAIAEKWPLGFLAIEPALTYLTICVVLTVTGAGARSVDTRLEPFVRGWIGRRLRRQPYVRQRVGVPTVLLVGGILAGAPGVREARAVPCKPVGRPVQPSQSGDSDGAGRRSDLSSVTSQACSSSVGHHHPQHVPAELFGPSVSWRSSGVALGGGPAGAKAQLPPGSATTTAWLRAPFQTSGEPATVFARRYGVDPKSVW
jgi:uncharacterized membrane protein YphA (DoxX/SURF4 family)